MGTPFPNPVVQNGTGSLVIPQIQSPNFSQSSETGWAILQSGLAFFFDVILSGGTITGPDYIINTSGAFFYSGTPAAGNLILSIASVGGADQFGNGYGAGFSSFGPFGTTSQITSAAIGMFSGLNVISELTPNGFFLYSPSGGLGNLIGSWATAAGTDVYGNVYPKGLNVTVGSISGTTFTGTDFIINSSGLFYYSGTPAAGNLLVSLVGAGVTTDPFGNAVIASGLTVFGSSGSGLFLGLNGSGLAELEFFATAAANFTMVNTSGQMTYNSSDNNRYNTGRLSPILAANQTGITTIVNINNLFGNVSPGTYRIHGVIEFVSTGTATTTFGFTGPAITNPTRIFTNFVEQGTGGTVNPNVIATLTTFASPGYGTNVGFLYIDGVITFTAGGSLRMTVSSTGTAQLLNGSFLDLMPCA